MSDPFQAILLDSGYASGFFCHTTVDAPHQTLRVPVLRRAWRFEAEPSDGIGTDMEEVRFRLIACDASRRFLVYAKETS